MKFWADSLQKTMSGSCTLKSLHSSVVAYKPREFLSTIITAYAYKSAPYDEDRRRDVVIFIPIINRRL